MIRHCPPLLALLLSACAAEKTPPPVVTEVPTVPSGLAETMVDCPVPSYSFEGAPDEASEFVALVLAGQGETIECEQSQNAAGRDIIEKVNNPPDGVS